jgi:hypothetical protein
MPRTLLLLATLALGACDEADEGRDEDTDETDSYGAMPYCDEVVEDLTPADPALGTTGGAFLDAIPADGATAVSWSDGDASTLAFAITVDPDSLRLVVAEAVYPETDGPSPSIAVDCPDYLAVEAVVTLETDDGRLAERIDAVLVLDEHVAPDGTIAFSASLDPDALGGTLDVASFLPRDDYDSVSLSLWAGLQGGALTGTLSAQGEGNDGDIAWAENIELAVIGGASEAE